jgi:hypothetical protein
MSTTAPPNPAQVPVSDHLYDPDESNSPVLEPLRPTLQPTPSSGSSPSSSTVSSPDSPATTKRPNRRRKQRTSQGYAVLIGHLDGHRRETASYADIEPLASESEDTEEPESPEGSISSSRAASPDGQWVGGNQDRGRPGEQQRVPSGTQTMSPGSPPGEEDMGAFDLKSLAADALAAVSDPHPQPDAGPTPPITENDVVEGRVQTAPAPMAIHTKRTDTTRDERVAATTIPSPYSPHSLSLYSPRDTGATPLTLNLDLRSPTASIHSGGHSEGLPPIQLNSPRFETNGQTLPSIRSQLGDIQQLSTNHVVGNGPGPSPRGFPGSPPATMPRLPSLQTRIVSPPMPPADPYRDPLSPIHHSPGPIMSPGYYYTQTNGLHRPPHDHAASSTDSRGSDPPGLTAAISGRDRRMSIEGITLQSGTYVCTVPGCTAQPFQTQYLLNSHANVHSTARPHYCPVPGCPRGEGGKGFKRKNEMIRHGLVHDSPGYVCPFCPEKDHKYPRPDNLQR